MNTLHILKAFVEGLRIVLTPCIMPILPLILAASLDGGKRRPYGVVFGFAFAFVGIAIFSQDIFAALQIDNETMRQIGLVLIAIIGIVMLLPQATALISRRKTPDGEDRYIEELSYRWDQEGGFLEGLGIGLLIALAWTPCVGPVMADALEEIRLRTNPQATAVVALFALGVGLPLLLIALLMRRAIRRVPQFNENGGLIRTILGAIILATVALVWNRADEKYLPSATRNNGILGKHLPDIKEQETEEKKGLSLPVIKPPPPKPLIDIEPTPTSPPVKAPPPAKPRSRAKTPPSAKGPSPVPAAPPLTKVPLPSERQPLRFGLNAENYVGETERQRDATPFYDPAQDIARGNWSLNGRWRVHDDKIVSASPRATLRLRFKARRVYAVMASPEGTLGKASIFLDGKPIAKRAGRDVQESNAHPSIRTAYELVNQPEPKEGQLDIVACIKGLEIYLVTLED